MSSSKLSDAVSSLLCNEQGRIWEHVRTDGNVATWRATQNVTLSSTLNLPQRVQRPCVAFCFKDDCVQINVDAAPVTNTDPETGRVRIVYPVVKPEALVEECRRKPDPDNIKVYALKFDPDSYKAGTPIYAARDMMLETSHRFGSIAIMFTRKNSDNTSDNPPKRRKQAEPSAASGAAEPEAGSMPTLMPI